MKVPAAALLLLLSVSPSAAFFWKAKADPAHEKLMQEAVAHLDAGDCASAVGDINSLLGLGPSRAIKERAYYCLGKCHEALGSSDRAISTYRLAAALYTDNPLFPKALAELYLANGFYDKAAELYRPLLKKDPSSAQLNLGLARSYAGQGALALAAAAYEAARSAGAGGAVFLAEYARCLGSMRDFKGALSLLGEARSAAPADAGLTRTMARMSALGGDPLRGAGLVLEVCGAGCRDGGMLFERGMYLLMAGDRAGALAALDAAAPLLPEGDQALALARGLALKGLGRAHEAAAALTGASDGESDFLAGLARAGGELK